MMLTVATQSRAPPYLAVTAGPASHSPPPMAEAPITRPGPIIASRFRQANRGASISSPASQRGIALLPGCGGTKGFAGVSGGVAVAVITSPGERKRVPYDGARRGLGQPLEGSGFRVQVQRSEVSGQRSVVSRWQLRCPGAVQ